MSDLHLTDEEIQEITAKKRWSAQVKYLRIMAIDARVRPDGKPLVVRERYLQLMGLSHSERDNFVEPDYSCLNAST